MCLEGDSKAHIFAKYNRWDYNCNTGWSIYLRLAFFIVTSKRENMKIKKAIKNHKCDCCQKPINKGETYKSERKYFSEDGKLYTYDYKECQKCIENAPKRAFKMESHSIRAKKRKSDCPDADFNYEWQGGWDSILGCADGGDVRLECHKCNLHCVKP